ncbi:MAG TPA: HD domain-containing protein [Syntrophales bacterium]|nr:HD domain-containing protein [Syntrophales bacterium]HOX93279.1 HD domain-containing protein [Syntrophales bacterium]HPI56247.1 HD domain-containing protein [Syntrophales bacterium]HPN24434.1 HD domain-containing protein [Syntrophales bacterium]HQM29064.1 HD domain-containing protein [Syntrophales bacterium]
MRDKSETKNLFVKDIRAGEIVKGTFLVTEKNTAFTQKGTPYINLRLRDRTGDIDGKIWDNAAAFEKLFKRGEVVYVAGRAVSYRNTLQINVSEISRVDGADIHPGDYSPVSREDIEGMFEAFTGYVDTIEDPWLRTLLEAFFADEAFVGRFKKAPAAKGFHHAYIGGLLEHTLSTVKLLDMVARHYPTIRRDLLITGGILHDIGKIAEFNFDGMIDYSTEGRLVGHIVMSVEMLDAKIAGIEGFPPALAMELKHILVSHHGETEFGSPKRPKTVEALVIHMMDDLDAKINAFHEFIESSADTDSDWTAFHRFFERFLYKGKTGA